MSTAPKTTPPVRNGPLGLRRTPDLGAGRPPIPPETVHLDARVEAAKSWSTSARRAARETYETALAGGASREEAIEAGHASGLRASLEEKGLTSASVDLVTRAASLFGGTVCRVIPAGRELTSFEERCFERLFPDREPPPPATPAAPMRSRESDSEDNEETSAKEAARAALAGGLAKKPGGGQKTFSFGA